MIVKWFPQLMPEPSITDLLVYTGNGNQIIGEPTTTEIWTGMCWHLAFLVLSVYICELW